MKNTIIALCLSALLALSLVSCTKNSTDTTSKARMNEGKVTETGTDTNIINRAETMLNDMMTR